MPSFSKRWRGLGGGGGARLADIFFFNPSRKFDVTSSPKSKLRFSLANGRKKFDVRVAFSLLIKYSVIA